MKKIYLVSLFFFSATAINCQTVTQAFNEPSVGDVDKNYTFDTSAYTSGLPSSVTGSNVVWDFTKVNGTFPMLFDSIVSPSSAAGGSAYPTASYAQKRGTINAFFKSGTSPSQTEWVGVYSPSLSITFTNSAVIATYPISYGYTASDPVTGTFKWNTTNGVCNGSLTVIADGLGTLNLPNNVSFQNVLRLRSVEELTMTIGFLPAGTINQSIFTYYVPGKKYPVITSQYQKYQLLAGTPTITATSYGNINYFTIAGVDDNRSYQKTEAYPNPFHDKLFIRSEPGLEPDEVRFYNLQGQLLVHSKCIDNFSTKELPPGIYILEITDQSKRHYQKMIKE